VLSVSSTLSRYGVTIRGNVTSVYPPLDPVRRGRAADLSGLLKVPCQIDTNVEHSFVTRIDMWILATVQPFGCAPALTFVLCLNPGKYH